MKYKEGLRPEGRCFILARNERACTPCGENFEQHRVRDAAVEADRRIDSGFERVQAGVDLWNHAAGDRRVGLQYVEGRAGEVGRRWSRKRGVKGKRVSARVESGD